MTLFLFINCNYCSLLPIFVKYKMEKVVGSADYRDLDDLTKKFFKLNPNYSFNERKLYLMCDNKPIMQLRKCFDNLKYGMGQTTCNLNSCVIFLKLIEIRL